jgi:phage I-like protein
MSAAGEARAPDAAADARLQWLLLVPAGPFHDEDGGGPYAMGDADQVARASANKRGTIDLPVDYDRQLDAAIPPNGAPAAGWINALETRDGALWARVEWTERAVAATRTGEYRFLDPVFEHTAGAITRISRASLTNRPRYSRRAIASSQPMSKGVDAAALHVARLLGLAPGDFAQTGARR